MALKKWRFAPFVQINADYLFMTYIVTSKPKRISVAAGVVHIINLLLFKLIKIKLVA